MNYQASTEKHNKSESGKKYNSEFAPVVSEDNRKRLIMLSGIVAVAMLVMLVVTYFAESLEKNRMIYVVICIICALISGASTKIKNRYAVIVMIYLFIGAMFVFGILLGTVIEPNETSVSFPILLFAMPLCFTERPLRMNLAALAGIIVYCIAAFATQEPLMIQYNLTNVIPYGMFSMFICSVMMRTKYNRYELQYQYEQSVKKLEKQFTFSEAVSRDTNDIFVVDIEKNSSTGVKLGGVMVEEAKQTVRDYDAAWKWYSEKYVHPDDRNDLLEATKIESVLEGLADKAEYSFRYRIILDGEIRYFRIAFSYLGEQGEKKLVFAFRCIDDIVREEIEQKQMLQEAKDEAEAANNAKTSFLFSMSHDIRTPMNAIIGYNQLIKRDLNDPEKIIHYQSKIEQASGFLLSLINNVLDMARIESGKMEVDRNYACVDVIVNEMCEVYEEPAKEKKLNFAFSVDVEHPHIMCDAVKVKEIFSNLISNAIKYTPPEGSVKVFVTEKACEREGYVLLESRVEDTGIGMSREYMSHLFEAFTREKNTTSGKVAGTGLGLAIVKSLVDLMGGTIEVQSELGKGSIFTFRLMHQIADEQYFKKDKAAYDQSAEGSVSTLAGKHVLLAEDNELNAEIATAILEDMGLSVDWVEDGIQCVYMIEQKPYGTFDLILMDIQMPNMDGYKATQIIRGLSDREKAEIPIVAMTANAFEEDKKNAFAAGMNGHIGKPIELAELKGMLVGILG